MFITMAVAFLMIFCLMLVACALGWRVYESHRMRQVTARLEVIADPRGLPPAKLLRDAESEATAAQRFIRQADLGKRAAAQIRHAGLGWTLPQFLTRTAAGAMIGGILGLAAPFEIPPVVRVCAVAALGAAMPWLYLSRKRAKRNAAIEQQLPEALDFLARSMRAGHAFTISLEMLGEEMEAPLGLEFRTLLHEHNLGAPIEIALQNLTERVPLLDVRFFASAVMLQRQTGGNLNEILTRLSYVIRERFRLKGQVRAASAHGRMTASILTALPILTMLALLVVAPGYLQGMAADPDGRHLIFGAVAAQVVGNLIMRKIIDIKV